MPVYKGRYNKYHDGTYQVDLYKDDTIIETYNGVPRLDDVKALIIVWYAQQGYTRPDITDQNFTEDWENWESLYVKP